MNEADEKAILAIAEAVAPGGDALPPPGPHTLAGVREVLDHIGPASMGGYRALLRTLEWAAVPLAGRRLSALAPDARRRVLAKLQDGPTYWAVRAAVAPVKLAQARSPELAESLDAPDPSGLKVVRERNRFEERIFDGRDLESDETIEVDAVVVGTGAGGGPVAHALAGAGHATLMLEEGAYFARDDFDGRPLPMYRKLYRDRGLTAALGNTVIPLPIGKTLGGTTTVNSGTCFRTPERVQRRWQLENGLSELRPGALDPYFERVERMLEIAPAEPEVLGGVARVIARGCEALGFAHGPLSRNAPGCDAQGVCCFGCPTDAKRSTNVSYVPAALERGAMVYTNVRVEEILRENGRAVGVVARAAGDNGASRRLTVRAGAVVLACGSIHTPALLMRNGLAGRSGQLGRNLTIHPAAASWAMFDERVASWAEIPQGYGIEEFVDQGIRFEGGTIPLHVAASLLGQMGPEWTETVERMDGLAQFGFMIEDSSRGRVTLGPGGKPQIGYWLNDADRRKIIRGHGVLARVYLAAGAQAVYPALRYFDELRNEADVERLEREGPDRIKARHMDLTAYHPLGTCRMGPDAARSVVDPSHQVHDVPGLYVADGSVVPGPLGVNPQVTIMGFAERAGDIIARRLEERSSPSASASTARANGNGERARIAFAETMGGRCEMLEGPLAGSTVDVAFHVRAGLGAEGGLAGQLARGGPWTLEGTLDWEGIAQGVPCEGTLKMQPLGRGPGLVYDLRFEVDGRPHELHGEKHLGLLKQLGGMTTLHTEIRRVDDGADIARGILRFDVGDLGPWLRSWRLGEAGAAA